ncbi:MAG: hypothetical protein GWN87_05995, partial [Desulfuromonadales bacterium]|nr:hypothetical protein [Desulfuromonadales bacterium]NIS40132.1 hypothetical protein [Desulfuromonadales bacterium]
ADKAGNPFFKPADESLPAEELAGGGEPAAAQALTAVEGEETPPAGAGQTPIDAQIGSAAWRLG